MEDEVAQESPEYADWIDRLEGDRSGRYLLLGAKRVSFTQVAVHDYGVPEDADAHEFWEAAFSAALAAFPGIPSVIFRISTDRTNSSWATFSWVAPSPLSSPATPA